MDPQLLSTAFKAEADALANLAELNRYVGQDPATHTPPSLTVHTETEKLFRGGRSGYFRVMIIVQSMQNNGGDHAARVQLVRGRFVVEKADRIAAINARGAVHINDCGLIGTKAETVSVEGASRFKTTFTFKVAAKLPAQV